MLFSPIAERSPRVRLLYAIIYLFLTLGGLTVLVPFGIMLSGSVETASQFTDTSFLPKFLWNDEALWRRYLEAKYQGNPDYLRAAWNDSSCDFETVSLDPGAGGDSALWKEFIAEGRPSPEYSALGFTRITSRMPGYANRLFRKWLEQKYGSLSEAATKLKANDRPAAKIAPPYIVPTGAPPLQPSPLLTAFFEFQEQCPPDWCWSWDIGGFYRIVFLPRYVDGSIENFNTRYGTAYASFSEVPFGSRAPVIAGDAWRNFVGQVLRPDFVHLTPEGETRRASLGLSRPEFISNAAHDEELIVESSDTKFAEWAARRGKEQAKIPQRLLDFKAFQDEKNFWRFQLPWLNFATVFDEILLHGQAARNTVILVVLSILGALTVNPLAAYALSRFKMRATFYLLLFFLATMAFPAEVTMIPVFLQLREFGLLNTFGALVLPGLANGFTIFLLKGFFDSLPRELYEAAEIDGASEIRMFWQFTMALSRPILAVVALGAFATAYGAFFYALYLAPDPRMWTVMVYIYQLRQVTDQPVVYASLLVTAVPTLLVFVFCQRIILRGIVVPSEK